MATSTSDDPAPEPAEQQHEPRRGRPYWSLREDDKRTLFITFVGGLAASVGLVLILGLGLVEARLIHRYQHSLVRLVLPQVLVIVISAVGVLLMAGMPRRTTRSDIILWRIGLGLAVLLGAILILGLVGYAAGVK